MEYNEERQKRYVNAQRYLEMVMFEMRQTPDNPTDPEAELRIYNGAEALINQLREGQNPDTSDEALHIGSVVNWLPFTEENVSHYNRLAREGKLIKLYDTGEQRHVNDDNFPMAVVTHYREG